MRIRHIKGAEEALKIDPLVIKEPEKFKGKWCQNVFKRNAQLFLEIGMGMGLFLRTQAAKHPEVNFAGLEINSTVLYKALKRYRAKLKNDFYEYETSGLKKNEDNESLFFPKKNLRFIWSDARFIEDFFALGELSKIYLNFPDPWPKAKTENRRLVSPNFLSIYKKILKPGGLLEFKTDDEGLFNYLLDALKSDCSFDIVAKTLDLIHDDVLNKENVLTEYEKKFIAVGKPIHKLIASTNPGANPGSF